MTFRLESERMFLGTLLAVALHGVLLILVQRLLDLDRDLPDYPGPLTVQLIAQVPPAATQATVEPAPPSLPTQEEATAPVLTPATTPDPVAAQRSEPEPKPAPAPEPEPVPVQEQAPVKTQAKAEADVDDAPATSPAPPWVPTLQRSVEMVPVRGRGGLNALSPAGGTPSARSGAAVATPALLPGQAVAVRPAGEYEGRGDRVDAFSEGLALPVDESVYARSASGPTPEVRATPGVSRENPVSVARDPGFLGQERAVAAPVMPVRMSGTPTATRGAAAGDDSRGAQSVPIVDSSPGLPESGSISAAVEVAVSAEAAGGETPSLGAERLAQLDQVLQDGSSGSDRTASAGDARGPSQQGAGGQPRLAAAGSGLRLPDGMKVSASLGLRRLVAVATPALPDGIPSEIVRSTVRVRITVDPQGRVRPQGFEPDSGSTALNNEIYAALRKWRYEPVQEQQPVSAVVTIEIRTRSA